MCLSDKSFLLMDFSDLYAYVNQNPAVRRVSKILEINLMNVFFSSRVGWSQLGPSGILGEKTSHQHGHESGSRAFFGQDVRRRAAAARGLAKVGRRSRVSRHSVPDRTGGSARLRPSNNFDDEVGIMSNEKSRCINNPILVTHIEIATYNSNGHYAVNLHSREPTFINKSVRHTDTCTARMTNAVT